MDLTALTDDELTVLRDGLCLLAIQMRERAQKRQEDKDRRYSDTLRMHEAVINELYKRVG